MGRRWLGREPGGQSSYGPLTELPGSEVTGAVLLSPLLLRTAPGVPVRRTVGAAAFKCRLRSQRATPRVHRVGRGAFWKPGWPLVTQRTVGQGWHRGQSRHGALGTSLGYATSAPPLAPGALKGRPPHSSRGTTVRPASVLTQSAVRRRAQCPGGQVRPRPAAWMWCLLPNQGAGQRALPAPPAHAAQGAVTDQRSGGHVPPAQSLSPTCRADFKRHSKDGGRVGSAWGGASGAGRGQSCV